MLPLPRVPEWLGWTGAGVSLAAFSFNSHGLLPSQSVAYLLLNVVGCGLLILYTYGKGAYANTTLNSVWLLVTLAALLKPVFLSSPAPVMESAIDRLILAYNAGDARAFADLFAPDATVYEHPNELTQRSREEIFRYYRDVFRQYPQQRTTVLHRTVIGRRVIDHERVQRSPAHTPFEVLTIYELGADGLIQRLDFVRDAEHIATVSAAE